VILNNRETIDEDDTTIEVDACCGVASPDLGVTVSISVRERAIRDGPIRRAKEFDEEVILIQ
jgi:hypothetical protein